MKDYSKVKEAEKLLIESGVPYMFAVQSKDKRGFCVSSDLTGEEFNNALGAMVTSVAEKTKDLGIPEDKFGINCIATICLGVKRGYGSMTEEVN